MGTQPGQQRADRVTIPDHHPVHAADLAGLGVDLQPPRRPDHGQGGLRPRAGHLEGHRAAGLGQAAVGEERAAPGGLAVAAGPGHYLPGQPAHRPPMTVHEPGLARQALAVLVHPHHVTIALAQAAGGQHDQLGGVAENLGHILAEPACRRAGVELSLDHDPPRGQVQPAGEPQQRGYLGLPAARFQDGDPAELVLHQTGHGHSASLPLEYLRKCTREQPRVMAR